MRRAGATSHRRRRARRARVTTRTCATRWLKPPAAAMSPTIGAAAAPNAPEMQPSNAYADERSLLGTTCGDRVCVRDEPPSPPCGTRVCMCRLTEASSRVTPNACCHAPGKPAPGARAPQRARRGRARAWEMMAALLAMVHTPHSAMQKLRSAYCQASASRLPGTPVAWCAVEPRSPL